MKKYFYGDGKKRSYFEGWYFRQQAGKHTVAVIPAFHADEEGKCFATIQVITEENSWFFFYPKQEFRVCRGRLGIKIGENLFTKKGMRLKLLGRGISLEGTIRFGEFTPPEKAVMGPFEKCPGMQCRHEVLILFHGISGSLCLNGNHLDFSGGAGYLEKDRGSSFPREYVWSQCSFEDDGPGCVMVSVANVPFAGGSFQGCICTVLYRGKQYRFATYTGAKILQNRGRVVIIRQGNWELRVMALGENAKTLRAPRKGGMGRRVQESAAGAVRYELLRGEERVFRVFSKRAGWERG